MRRIQSLDLARGSTVLFIPAIHSVMLFSQEQVRTSWLGYPLRFIAEGAGAQVLMMVMGILFTLKPKYSAKAVCLRALALLFAGYLLNVIKFAIPYATGILPEEILIELQINQEKNVLLQLTAMGDILHFAAIAISLLFIIYQCEYYRIWSFALALIIIVGGPLLYDSESSNPSINYLFQFFTGQPPRVFFPVFPWLVYPLIGLSIGYYWQHHARWVYTYCLHIAWGCFAVGMITSWCFPQNNPSGFYRTYPAATCIHVSIVLFWLGGWQWVREKIKSNSFFSLLTFCSKNITMIYLVQWILICWCLPLFGYQTLNTFQSLMAAIYLSAITLGLTFLITRKT